MNALAERVHRHIIAPDWVYDLLDDKTHNRRFWVTKGLGAGGTYGSALWHLLLCKINKRSKLSWAIAPTYQQVVDTLIPTFVEVMTQQLCYRDLEDFEVIRSGFPRIHLLRTGQEIHFKSGNKPERLVGASISHCLMTEPGLIKREAYEKSSARLRCPKAERIQYLLEGTPEGLGNFYEQEANFEGEIDNGRNYRRIVLWTVDNLHLPSGYVDNLKRTYAYDPHKLESYLYGRFIPFTKGNAYWEFAHSRNVKLDLTPSEHSTITITWDWNHTPLAFVAWQKKNIWTKAGDKFARIEVLGESSGRSKGIMDACAEFIAQFPPEKFRNTPIEVDGASDGFNKSHLSSLCAFDQVLQTLRKYYNNVSCVADKHPPRIEHRLQRHNALLAYGYLVIAAWCRNTIKAHEQTNLKKNTWETEKPDGEDWTHWGEALGYSIFRSTKGLDLDKNDGKNRKIYGLN